MCVLLLLVLVLLLFHRIVPACKRLVALNASGWKRMQYKGVRELRALRHLSSLSMAGTPIEDRGIVALCGVVVTSDARGDANMECNAPLQLRCLDVRDCHALTDTALHAVSKGCPHLQELYIGASSSSSQSLDAHQNSAITPQGLCWVAKCCKLVRLAAGMTHAVSEHSLQVLCRHVKHLQRVRRGVVGRYVSFAGCFSLLMPPV